MRFLWVGCLVALVGCAGPTAGARTPQPAAAAEGDVAAGFAAYREALALWGTWEPDGLHDVRWCPASEPRDDAPWREITAGRGLWLRDDIHGRTCWVPGVRSGEGRTVVRSTMAAPIVTAEGESLSEKIQDGVWVGVQAAAEAAKVAAGAASAVSTVSAGASALSGGRSPEPTKR